MRRLQIWWACLMALALQLGVCFADEVLQLEVISREVSVLVGHLSPSPPPVLERVTLVNGGFESSNPARQATYWTNLTGWTGSGNPSFGGPLVYGRENNGSFPTPPEKEQAVGLQKDSAVETPVTIPHLGAYFLSWRHASRSGQVNPYVVFTNRVSGTLGIVSGNPVQVSPVYNTSSTEWVTVWLPMWFNNAGIYLLGFAGLNSGGGDETVVLDDVQLMRYISEGTRSFPEMREVVSREASVYVEGNDGNPLKEAVSREVSFTVDAVGTPPPVLDLALTVFSSGETVTVDWSRFYDPWKIRDIAAFRIYQSAIPFDSVDGRIPARIVSADTLSSTFTGLPIWKDSYFAVVPVDALGNAGTEVVYSGAYVLMPEVVSRETSFFVGEGPNVEVISREASVLVDNPNPPSAVSRFLVKPSANGESVTLDWSSYNSWEQKDVTHFRVYYSDRFIASLEGVLSVQVPGETFQWTLTGLTPWTDHYFAVIPVDGLGNSTPSFHYQGAYVLMPEVVSREANVFIGNEPDPPFREVVSREASFVVADMLVPAPVTGVASGFFAGTSRSQYGAVDLDWTAYADEEQRDIVRYRMYASDRFFTNVTGMAWTVFPENPNRWDGKRRGTIQGLNPAQIYYVAVVAEDAVGQVNPVVYSVSAKSSIGSVGDIRNLTSASTLSTWEVRWEVGVPGDNVEDFLKEVRVYSNRQPSPILLQPLSRSYSLPALLAAGTTTVRVTTVDIFGAESPGLTIGVSVPQPFIGTNASVDEMNGYLQDLLLRDGTFPVAGLTVGLISGPAGLVVTNGILAWTPTEAQGPSINSVLVAVSDGMWTTTNRLQLEVKEVNNIPTLAGATNASVSELVGYVQDLIPRDTDLPLQPLTVTLLSGPAGLVVTNSVLAWTPTAAQGPSTNLVVVAVSDGAVTLTNRFIITVRAALVPLRLSGSIEYYATGVGPVSGALVTVGGGATGSTITGTDGAYSIEVPISAFTLTPTLGMDTPVANGVTTADITLIRRHVLGLKPLDSVYKVLAGDVNGSDSVTTADITLIRRLILGATTNFSAGLWRFVPSDEVFTNTTTPWTATRMRQYVSLAAGTTTGQDFKAIKLGDVNGSWRAPLVTPGWTIKSGAKGRLVIGKVRAGVSNIVNIPVSLSGVDRLGSLQMTLSWDANIASFEGVEGLELAGLNQENLGLTRVNEGFLSVSWDHPSGRVVDLTDTAKLFQLKLRSKEPTTKRSEIRVTESPTRLELTDGDAELVVAVDAGWLEIGVPGEVDSDLVSLRLLGLNSDGRIELEARGPEGMKLSLEASDTLKTWVEVQLLTGRGNNTPVKVTLQPDPNVQTKFWRVLAR